MPLQEFSNDLETHFSVCSLTFLFLYCIIRCPLQYSCLENPMDGGPWYAAVHGVAKSWTQLSDFPFTFHFHALEKEMATYSGVLTCRIPGTGEPGGLPSMGSHRVGHDWSNLAAAAAATGVFIRKGKCPLKSDTQEEGHVMTEAEFSRMEIQAKGSQVPADTSRCKERFYTGS